MFKTEWSLFETEVSLFKMDGFGVYKRVAILSGGVPADRGEVRDRTFDD